jgi:hypothetical protein
MRRLIREKPWLLVIAGILFFLLLSVAMLVIALSNPPVLIR